LITFDHISLDVFCRHTVMHSVNMQYVHVNAMLIELIE